MKPMSPFSIELNNGVFVFHLCGEFYRRTGCKFKPWGFFTWRL